MTAKAETEAEAKPSNGIVSTLDGVILKVEEVTDYIADALLCSENEEKKRIPDEVREPDDVSVDYSDISDGYFTDENSAARAMFGHEKLSTNKPEATVTIIPFKVEEPGRLLGRIKIKGVTSNNIAYVASVSTCNGACKELRPGDVLAHYQLGVESPKPYTLEEFTYLLVSNLISNERPLHFVAIRSGNI
jgi:hypothetical protein